MLDIHLLGQARICVDNKPIKFAKRNVTLAMLAYLVLHRDRPLAREFLAFTVFSDLDETTALNELRRYLYLAQKALPPNQAPWILVDTDAVQWNPRVDVRIDVAEFENLARQNGTLRAAVDAYDGDLLPEIYDDWVLTERERLRTIYLNALSTLVLQARSERDYAVAIAYAQRLLACDPWREDIFRHLLAARYEIGDATGALAEYDRFARSAREELRVDPMPETRALRDAIAAGTSLPSSMDRPRDARRRAPAGLPFCGRTREFERVRHAWERAARGKGGVVIIEGEPGIGKSRLAAELAIAVENEGGRVLTGSTSFPETVPYQCVIDALRSALPLVGSLPQNRLRTALLAQVLPELRAREPDLPDPPAVAPEREQARLFDSIGSTLSALARARPLLVVFEDVHWAGYATLELLRTLARRTSNGTMLIVLTFRDEEVTPEHPLRALQRELTDERLALRIALARFTREDVASVLERTPNANKGDAEVDRLFSYSEGNPLFLNEAIRESLESGFASGPNIGIRQVIQRRLERLSADAMRLAYGAAVCGNAFDADVVCHASGVSGAEALRAFDDLLDRHIVREVGAAGGFEYAFTHHLIATTLYAMIDVPERRRRHARSGQALERVHHAQIDRVASEIGRHYAEAGEAERAAGWYARAARNAAAMFAHDDAARYATRALEGMSDRTERAAMLLMREQANARLGRRDEQVADLNRLDALALKSPLRAEALHRRVELLHAVGDRDAERRAIAELRAEAQQNGDGHWQGVADCADAWCKISIGDYAGAEQLVRTALKHLEISGSAAERTDALSALAEIEVSTGSPDAAERTLRQAQTIAREAGDGRALVGALMQAVAAAVSLQQFERVEEFGAQAAALYRSQGDRIGEARALVSMAAASVRLWRWESAREANLRAAATFELAGDRRGLARVLMNLGMLHGRCGDFEQGRNFIARAREHQLYLGDDRARTASLLNESFLALWQGEAKQARALARQALRIADAMGHTAYRAQALANLGAAERDLGDLDAAIAYMQDGLSLQLALGRLPDAVSDLADAALAHFLRGNRESALELIDRILELDRAWTDAAIFPPYPPWVAARILHAAADGRAAEALAWASRLAASFAASIDVPELRACFEALPFVSEIRSAAERDIWPPLPVR